MGKQRIQIEIGQRFGRLEILKEVESLKKYKRRRFLCKCDCGTIKESDLIHLTQGNTISCGCRVKTLHKGKFREDSANWKGGKITDDSGYIQIYDPLHNRAKTNGYVREHIIVMEEKLGRTLIKGENVHHINGIKNDNRPENLELWSTSQPYGQRVEDKIKWAKEILELYKNYVNE